MLLNAALLYEELKDVFQVRLTGPVVHSEHLHHPLLYQTGMPLQSDRIYVALGKQLDPDVIPPKNCCVVSIGEPPELYLNSQAACIVADGPLDVGVLLNQIQDIFETFSQWESDLEALVQRNADIQEILDRSQPFFPGNFFLIVDASYRVLATTSERDYVMDQNGRTPSSVLTRFKKDPEYARMRYHKETFLYRGRYFDHDILTHHIFINDELSGTFTLAEKESPITDGRWTLFEYLSGLISRYYQQRFYLLHAVTLPPAAVLSQLLRGEIVSRSDLVNSLSSAGWDVEHDSYVACFIAVHEADKKIHSTSYLCNQLESILAHSLAVEHQSDIVVVLNTSKIGTMEKASQATVSKFLQETMLKAGVSRPFHNLMQLKNYYHQARAAVNVGTTLYPERPLHRFSEYLLIYMLNNIPGDIEPESLCPEGLLALNELDRKRGSSYVKTLDVYFRTGFNATQSAKMLYINRSTFLERMEKIKKTLGLDLEDYDSRLYLMLCLRLLAL